MSIKRDIDELLGPSNTILVTGNRGSGKSWTAMFLAAYFLRDPHHYVFSNIICLRKNPETLEEEVAYPERYIFVRSFARLFVVWSEIKINDPAAEALLVLDEAALSIGYLDFVSKTAKSAVKFNTLIRKLKICVLIIAIRTELLAKKFREYEGGFVTARIIKDPHMLYRYAGDILRQGYDRRQVALIDWPEFDIHYDPIIVGEAPVLACRPELCVKGEIYYDTEAPADFGVGFHPVTKRPFDLSDLLLVISGVPGSKTAPLVYDFMHRDPAPFIEAARLEADEAGTTVAVEPTKDEASTTPPPPDKRTVTLRKGTRTDWKLEAVLLALKEYPTKGDSEIARLVSRGDEAVSRQFVHRIRREVESGERPLE